MTLAEIRSDHRHLFHPQNWFLGHAFMDVEATGLEDFTLFPRPLHPHNESVHAVDLAKLYVESPDDDRWRYFLWTDDADDHGNRIYVGGCGQFGCERFQIHRALDHVGDQWRYVQP